MTTLLAQAFDNLTTTLNRNPAYKSTLDPNLDLFASIAAYTKDDPNLLTAFSKAAEVNEELALRILLWSRDCRGGAGRRDPLRTLLPRIAKANTDLCLRLIPKIPVLGRWDDLLTLHDCGVPRAWAAVVAEIAVALDEGNGLCAKWLPRKGPVAAKLRNDMGLSPKRYRKLLVNLTKVVENNMCANQWHDINFSHVPSVAFARYRKAFAKHEPARFQEFLDLANKGEVKINAAVAFPHDVLRGVHWYDASDQAAAEAQWKNLPDYLEGSDERILCLVDVSGSMRALADRKSSLRCMDISVALGLYIAERVQGKFHNQVLTFESQPHWVSLKGTLTERYHKLLRAPWGGSTNFDGAMQRILSAGIKHNLSESEMPTVLLVLSDMQFNRASRPMGEQVKAQYRAAGYKMPKIVFWNLRDYGNKPALATEGNVVQVSGWSPSLLPVVLQGLEDYDPDVGAIQTMLDSVMKERYYPY